MRPQHCCLPQPRPAVAPYLSLYCRYAQDCGVNVPGAVAADLLYQRFARHPRHRWGNTNMKYAVWLVRLWYAAWMIPAGLEHFIHIFPQPGYNTTRPLAHEMLFALLHSHLFDVVKAVELLTGSAVLLGFFTPLMLLVCMPVAFCVFSWDAPLSSWNYGSVMAGGRVLASDLLLCVAFISCYRAMFALRAKPQLQSTAQAATSPAT